MKHIQLEKTIRLVASKSGKYKTILYTSSVTYIVVTRVNYLSAMLWIEYVNNIIKSNPKLQIDTFKKPNWLIMMKSYRRDFLNDILNKL